MMALFEDLGRTVRLSMFLWMAVILSSASVVHSRSIARNIQNGEFNGIDYLAAYGYLSRAPMETGALRSEKEFAIAIKEFQKMAALPETGKLDQKTIEKMQAPRCGIVDKNSTSGGPQNFQLGPSKWEKKHITYRINNYSPDLYWGYTEDAVAQAFNIWAEKTSLTFSKIDGPADIEVSFGRRYHQDGYDFDGAGNVLAHAFPPGDGRGGDAHFDEDETWTVKTKDGTNLFTVAAHEFGHSLGIYHSNVQGALMYPWYQGYVPNLELHYDDIKAIQTLYGGPIGKPPPTTPTTRSPQKITSPAIRTLPPTRATPPSDNEPDSCSSDVDAVTNIRGETFAFKGKHFWRMDRYGKEVGPIAKISDFWRQLPKEVQYIDAVYERQDGYFVIFKGNRFWVLSELNLAPGCPVSGKPLTDYGLDPGVTHIDAIFVWGLNGRTYIFSGYSYWKMNEAGTKVEKGYPRPTDMWNGIPIPFDTVFTRYIDSESRYKTYFIKGDQHWAFNDQTMKAEPEYPKPLREFWSYCPPELRSGFSNDRRASLNLLGVYALLAITLNIFW